MNQFRWLDHIVNPKELVEKLIEVMSVTSTEVQKEIIACLPEIIDDDSHSEVADYLSQLMNENNEVTLVVLDTLSNLTLSIDLLDDVRAKILKTLSSIEQDYVPVAVKFILQSVESSTAFDVLLELRENLDFNTTFPATISSTPFGTGMLKKDSREYELLILDVIKSSIRFQNFIADAWLKVIESITSPSQHKVIDIYILFILHLFSTKKKSVESLFRIKIRNGCFNEILLQGAFGSNQVIVEFFTSVLKLSEIFLASFEKEISYIGSIMYVLGFKATKSYGNQEIIASLINHVGSGNNNEINQAISVLLDIAKSHPSEMCKYNIFIKSTLDFLDNLTLPQIRLIYCVLCTLAYNKINYDNSIQDELNIIIRKQLSNPVHKYKRMGVIGAIMAVRAVASEDDEEVLLDQTADLDKSNKDAVHLLEMVKSSSKKTPHAMALFFDELTDAISNGDLNSKLLVWTNDAIVSDFQDDFIVDIDPKKSCDIYNGFEVSLQLNLDPLEKISIALNLFPVLADSKKVYLSQNEDVLAKFKSPTVIVSQFRLLQVCELLTENDKLDGIDALLGCPIVMPEFSTDDFESYSIVKQHIICDCLFIAMNWMRELVNAFVSQSDETMKSKVFKRISNIFDLQNKTLLLLSRTRNYRPPVAKFDVEVNPNIRFPLSKAKVAPKKGKKRGEKRKHADDSIADPSVLNTQETISHSTEDKDNIHTPHEPTVIVDILPFLREIDMNVFKLLNESMVLSTEDDKKTSLPTSETIMLLEDLCRKLTDSSIKSKSKGYRPNIGNNNQVIAKISEKNILSAIKLLPCLCELLEAAVSFFQSTVAESDGILDNNLMFTSEGNDMTSIMTVVLKIIYSVLSWDGFNLKEQRNLLKDVLRVFVQRTDPEFKHGSLQSLLTNSSSYLMNYIEALPSIDCIVFFVKIFERLDNWYEEKDESALNITKICEKFLKHQWNDPEGKPMKGSLFNSNVHTFFSSYLKFSKDVVNSLEFFVTGPVSELVEVDGKSAFSESYPTLNKQTFSIFYRLILNYLVQGIKKINYCRGDSSETHKQKLSCWILAVRVFHIVVHLIKIFDSRSNLLSCLKNGRLFIEIFLKQAMPLLEQLFKSYQTDVINLLKNLQLSTRFLQHVCSHSKVNKDVSLTNQVPFLKKSLEMLLFRVKAMLALNNCLEAFWIGNLKNRDLQGEEIISEHSVADSESENEEIPGEEEEECLSDIDLDKKQSKTSGKSDADSDDESNGEGFSDVF